MIWPQLSCGRGAQPATKVKELILPRLLDSNNLGFLLRNMGKERDSKELKSQLSTTVILQVLLRAPNVVIWCLVALVLELGNSRLRTRSFYLQFSLHNHGAQHVNPTLCPTLLQCDSSQNSGRSPAQPLSTLIITSLGGWSWIL